MATFSDEYQCSDDLTFPYRHKSWDEDEVWRFADMKTDLDSKRIRQIQQEIASPDDVGGATMNALATLYVMTRSWSVRLPQSFVQPQLDAKRKPVKKQGKVQTEPHPLAGKTPPVTLEWVRKVGEPILIDAFGTLVRHYAEQYGDKEDGKSAETAVPDPAAAGAASGV